jgi:membrane protein implicated in regulation of membrane protease activity
VKNALRAAGVLALIALVLAPGAAFAGTAVAPELDPDLSIAALALLGGAAAFVIERYRRRAK